MAGKSITAFAALMPDAALTALVQGHKDTVRTLVGEQRYLEDPPHLTLYLAEFASAAVAQDAWQRIAPPKDGWKIKIVGWHVFVADALTGGHTLVCQIADDDKTRLRRLQAEAIGMLAPARDQAATLGRLAPRMQFLNDAQRASVQQCGFPYVSDWEPHFTIASIRSEDWNRAWNALEPLSPQGTFSCAQLRLYALADGKFVPLD